MKKLANQQSGSLGETLALAKINSLSLPTYVTPEGAPGHDLIVICDGIAKSIEVKTRQYFERPTEISRWPVNMATKGDADFFLFVELNLGTMTSCFYLLNNEQAKEIYRDDKSGGNCPPAQVRLRVEANNFDAPLN